MLEIINLKKSYNTRPALRGLNFKLEKGEIYGLLGPNGAGKTTTLKILAGLISINSGEIIINGDSYNWENSKIKQFISYVPDEPFLYPKLTGEEHLHFYADLYKIPPQKRGQKIDFFFKYLEFESYRFELVENYSAGTRQKLLISQALMVEPKILLLDEPLASIDPLVGKKFKELLKDISKKGTSVIFATHILSLAQEVSDKIGIIVNGEIVAEGSLEELLAQSAEKSLEDFYFKTVLKHDHPYPG
jgi:ABC-2 type transport system ATP-binding protein